MKPRIEDLFFQAALRRGLSVKGIARLAGCSAQTMERLQGGKTKRLDASAVYKVAQAVPDPGQFLREVFADIAMPTAFGELTARIAEVRSLIDSRLAATGPFDGCWCLDDGTSSPVFGDFEGAARQLAGLPASAGDAVDYVCRGFGWIALMPGSDAPTLRFDRHHVDQAACIRAAAILDAFGRTASDRQQAHIRVDDGSGDVRLETRHEAIRILERRILASRRTPTGWVDHEIEMGAAQDDLRAVVDGGFYDAVVPRLAGLLSDGRSSLFSVTHDEAFCIHIGRRFKVPTERDTGMRVLDRTKHLHYAALVDRHVVRASRLDKPTVSRVGADFEGGRRILYERLALPFALGSQSLVLTTSRVISDTGGSHTV